eukprot:CAMPEP_0171072002 /NCGR_PEP_ID=MMETSP0766_2-20121228/10615_1 /TAXON_ID=439317 /ORGANISM="Gambierdiscus australes, Strain CAWD 149" /LENGTH=548 /DNA_ID=CAMNT_0011528561 /DNA_START=52 /DNA_END=1698 /DNA_ORIENTATION=-
MAACSQTGRGSITPLAACWNTRVNAGPAVLVQDTVRDQSRCSFRHLSVEQSGAGGYAGRVRRDTLVAMLLGASCLVWRRRHATRRRVSITGPGWTDEIARIFDPRPEGPDWPRHLGYRGRAPLRLLLDGEDLVHSYAQALYRQTGKWTGPLSAGVEHAWNYGVWSGGAPEVDPNRNPQDPILTPPEILTFVAMPADLIEAVNSGNVCDGYPGSLREELGRCMLGSDGVFINEWLRSIEDMDRLITWNQPARLWDGRPRPNALMRQKYYEFGEVTGIRRFRVKPVVLSQVMGSSEMLKVGSKVEALKSGRLVNDKWIPSQWKKAEVLAVNYDGTYDLQFEMNFGPYRENRQKNLKGLPQLSLRKNEVYAGFGADTMPAKFRLMQELNYAQGVQPDKIRLPGMLDRISDTSDAAGNQDWYLCSSRRYVLLAGCKRRSRSRLEEFRQRFHFSYQWVPTSEGGLRFEPVPNLTMAGALRANHNDVAQQFKIASNADELQRQRLQKYKDEMSLCATQLEQIPPVPASTPSRRAGPKPTKAFTQPGTQFERLPG